MHSEGPHRAKVIFSDSSNNDDGAKGMDPNPSQNPSQSSSNVEDSLEDKDEGDLRQTFGAHITAESKDIPDELWAHFKIDCLTYIKNFKKRSTKK